jgi:amidophosphoribosyltransferase
MRQGAALAKKVLRERPQHGIDVVIPIPDTSRVAGQSLAYELGVKFREGFMKNRYIGRTFIMPGQSERKKSVRQKLNPVPLEFQDKTVLLVDDSIVRGTTCGQIIQMAREAGAKQVYFASAAPPVRFPNVYGIDMPAADELIAHGRTVEEVRAEIGADWLVYQDLEDLLACSREGNPAVDGFESSVFDGEYLTGNIDEHYLQSIQAARADSAKRHSDAVGVSDGAVVGLHNDS